MPTSPGAAPLTIAWPSEARGSRSNELACPDIASINSSLESTTSAKLDLGEVVVEEQVIVLGMIDRRRADETVAIRRCRTGAAGVRHQVCWSWLPVQHPQSLG